MILLAKSVNNAELAINLASKPDLLLSKAPIFFIVKRRRTNYSQCYTFSLIENTIPLRFYNAEFRMYRNKLSLVHIQIPCWFDHDTTSPDYNNLKLRLLPKQSYRFSTNICSSDAYSFTFKLSREYEQTISMTLERTTNRNFVMEIKNLTNLENFIDFDNFSFSFTDTVICDLAKPEYSMEYMIFFCEIENFKNSVHPPRECCLKLLSAIAESCEGFFVERSCYYIEERAFDILPKLAEDNKRFFYFIPKYRVKDFERLSLLLNLYDTLKIVFMSSYSFFRETNNTLLSYEDILKLSGFYTSKGIGKCNHLFSSSTLSYLYLKPSAFERDNFCKIMNILAIYFADEKTADIRVVKKIPDEAKRMLYPGCEKKAYGAYWFNYLDSGYSGIVTFKNVTPEVASQLKAKIRAELNLLWTRNSVHAAETEIEAAELQEFVNFIDKGIIDKSIELIFDSKQSIINI